MIVKEKIPLSPADRERQLVRVKYMLFTLGFSQKRVAYELRISKDTVCKWVKENGWRELLKGKTRLAKTAKFDESLTAFMVYVKIHNKALYNTIEPVYKQYLKTV